MNLSFKIIQGIDNLPECKIIREKVFIEEQKFLNEFDELDASAIHELIYDDLKPIATARALTTDFTDTYKLGRICVLKEYRKNGIGKILVENLENYLRELGVKHIKISAQCRVQGFYKSLGYTAYGDEYLDEYCPHIDMKKDL